MEHKYYSYAKSMCLAAAQGFTNKRILNETTEALFTGEKLVKLRIPYGLNCDREGEIARSKGG